MYYYNKHNIFNYRLKCAIYVISHTKTLVLLLNMHFILSLSSFLPYFGENIFNFINERILSFNTDILDTLLWKTF